MKTDGLDFSDYMHTYQNYVFRDQTVCICP